VEVHTKKIVAITNFFPTEMLRFERSPFEASGKKYIIKINRRIRQQMSLKSLTSSGAVQIFSMWNGN